MRLDGLLDWASWAGRLGPACPTVDAMARAVPIGEDDLILPDPCGGTRRADGADGRAIARNGYRWGDVDQR